MGLLVSRGAHGTSTRASKSIARRGFEIGQTGLRGAAVYFWHEGPYYLELACGWYRQRRGQRGVVVTGVVSADESRYLNLEDRKIPTQLDQLARTHQLNVFDRDEITRIYNTFITALEEETGEKIQVVLCRVNPPRKEFCPNYSVNFLGAPWCIAVRDPSCITVDKKIGCNNE